ncbi:MAG: hypothetical protein ACYDG6_04955 [Thermincolia bacterium]
MGRSNIQKKIFRLDKKAAVLMDKRSAYGQRIKNIEDEKAQLLEGLDPEEREYLKAKIAQRSIEELKPDNIEALADRNDIIEGLAQASRSNKEMKALLRDIQAIVESLANGDLGELKPSRSDKVRPVTEGNLPVQGDSMISLLKSPLFQQMAIRIFSYILNNKKK